MTSEFCSDTLFLVVIPFLMYPVCLLMEESLVMMAIITVWAIMQWVASAVRMWAEYTPRREWLIILMIGLAIVGSVLTLSALMFLAQKYDEGLAAQPPLWSRLVTGTGLLMSVTYDYWWQANDLNKKIKAGHYNVDVGGE